MACVDCDTFSATEVIILNIFWVDLTALYINQMILYIHRNKVRNKDRNLKEREWMTRKPVAAAHRNCLTCGAIYNSINCSIEHPMRSLWSVFYNLKTVPIDHSELPSIETLEGFPGFSECYFVQNDNIYTNGYSNIDTFLSLLKKKAILFLFLFSFFLLVLCSLTRFLKLFFSYFTMFSFYLCLCVIEIVCFWIDACMPLGIFIFWKINYYYYCYYKLNHTDLLSCPLLIFLGYI